jgi:hypothetical protein
MSDIICRGQAASYKKVRIATIYAAINKEAIFHLIYNQ